MHTSEVLRDVRKGGEVELRLIDAYALQDAIQKSKMENPHNDTKVAKNHEFEHDHFMKMVVMQPTAQEEIIRCKDCKWYDEQISMCDNCRLPREQTFFCADGKRRGSRNE